MENTDIAYMAGILDGEGHIGIYKAGAKSYQLEVGVTNANYWVLSWLQSFFNGKIRGPYSPERVMRWRVKGKQAINFLEIVLPYLRLKKAQAELAIKFQQRKRYYGRGSVPDEELALREADRILCHNLKGQQYGNVKPELNLGK